MNSLAPGQFLGYALQFPRAFYHLLKSGPGDKISIEVLGDVATLKSNKSIISEEDKSSIIGNPITNRSTDLWKTFYNWMNYINSGILDVKNTKFILFCNQSGRYGIVNQFSDAQSFEQIETAIEYTKSELKDLNSEHEIWNYFDFVVNENESLLKKIISHFELEVSEGVGYDEIRYEVRRLHIPETQIDFFIEALSGWIQKKVIEKIVAKEKAILEWEAFDHQFSVLFQRAQQRELIDFSLRYPPETQDVENQVKTRPNYLKQLEIIDSSDEDILEAVYEYLKADVNRSKWIENEIIDEEIASEFESNLKEFWKNQKKKIQITNKNISDEEKGQLLLIDCKTRKELIRNINPPSSTIAGTYHALADEPVLGWHPNWENIFLIQKEV